MWINKKIALLSDPQLTLNTVLTHETVAQHQQALTVTALAERQAAARLQEAQQQAHRLLAETQDQIALMLKEEVAQQQQAFCAQAEQLFAHWQEQREQWQLALLPQAEALLSQAMSQLLDQQPDTARLQAMLGQLAKAQGRQAAATLICAPAQQSAISEWLDNRPQLIWEISTDAALEADQLILTTEKGELHLSWSRIRQTLLP